jgi:hypothetical protein
MASKKRKRGALYFTAVAGLNSTAASFTAHYYALEDSDDLRTAWITLRDKKWGGIDVSGIAHALRLSGRPTSADREYLLLERNRGLYRVSPSGEVKFSRINEERDGFLMDLREIAGKWYAVGGNHQIYRLDGRSWKPIDDGVYVAGEEGEAKMLWSIDGTSNSNLYAVGSSGVIYHFDGKHWELRDSPTNCGFQRVLCVSNEEVYVCGYANSLYRGDADGWRPLSERDQSVIFWDMAYFKGKLYVCSKKKLYVLENDELAEVDIPVAGPLGFYRMDVRDETLWTCGNECVLQFDGKKWMQHVFPDNV